jgi:hypothetical protein
MNDEVLTRFADRFAAAAEPQAADSEQEVNAGAFGFLRGARERALMLEFRLKDGNSKAYSYALLDRATFDASDGIRLRFSSEEVRVTGQALKGGSGSGAASLFELILRHKATWIQESSRADYLQTQPGSPIVESISIG